MSAQKTVIGTILIDHKKLNIFLELGLQKKHFTTQLYSQLFDICMELNENKIYFNDQTVAHEAKNRGFIQNVLAIEDVYNAGVFSHNLDFHFKKIVDEYRIFELKNIAIGLNQSLRGHPDSINVDEVTSTINNHLMQIESDSSGKKIVKMKDAFESFLLETEDKINKYKSGEQVGIDIGFKTLQEKISLMPNDLIIIGARPATGKTTLMSTITRHAITNGAKTLVYTLEMTNEEIIGKLISSVSNIPTIAMRNGSLTDEQADRLMYNHNKITNHHKNLFLNDDRSLTLERIRSQAIAQKAKTGLDLVLIDYTQIIQATDTRAPREQQVAHIARGLKALAKELKLPVVSLAQVNRDSDKKGSAPKISDLRESGALEQEADAILLLHREKGQYSDKTKLIIAKNRHGETGEIELEFRPMRSDFTEALV